MYTCMHIHVVLLITSYADDNVIEIGTSGGGTAIILTVMGCSSLNVYVVGENLTTIPAG